MMKLLFVILNNSSISDFIILYFTYNLKKKIYIKYLTFFFFYTSLPALNNNVFFFNIMVNYFKFIH